MYNSCSATLQVIIIRGKPIYGNKFCLSSVGNKHMKKCYRTFCKHMLYLTSPHTL